MRKIFHRFFITVLVVGSILLSADSVWACSCMKTPLLDQVEFAQNIVVLKLQEVDENSIEKDSKKPQVSKFLVAKVYKGDLKVGQTIEHREGFICSWAFNKKDVGTEYLFYLDKPNNDGFWNGHFCTRSGILKYSGDDLLYLDKLAEVGGRTRISGTLVQESRPYREDEDIQRKLLAGHQIKIVGRTKRIELTTDKNGAFEVYDLPSGNYEIIPQQVAGYEVNRYGKGNSVSSAKVYLPPKKHAEARIEFTISNSISGRIIDTRGNPMEGVTLELKPAVGKASIYSLQFEISKQDGSFKFEEIPAGNYVMIANKKGAITADEPFKTSYFPKTTNINEAKRISVGAGDHLKDFTVTVSPTATVVTVMGVFQYSDGKPVVAKTVKFFKDVKASSEIKDARWADSRVQTDKSGRFSFRMLEGEKGILYGSVYEGDLKGCSNLQKARKINLNLAGLDFEYFNTNSVVIDAEKALDGIILKFPFPSCKKAKK